MAAGTLLAPVLGASGGDSGWAAASNAQQTHANMEQFMHGFMTAIPCFPTVFLSTIQDSVSRELGRRHDQMTSYDAMDTSSPHSAGLKQSRTDGGAAAAAAGMIEKKTDDQSSSSGDDEDDEQDEDDEDEQRPFQMESDIDEEEGEEEEDSDDGEEEDSDGGDQGDTSVPQSASSSSHNRSEASAPPSAQQQDADEKKQPRRENNRMQLKHVVPLTCLYLDAKPINIYRAQELTAETIYQHVYVSAKDVFAFFPSVKDHDRSRYLNTIQQHSVYVFRLGRSTICALTLPALIELCYSMRCSAAKVSKKEFKRIIDFISTSVIQMVQPYSQRR